MGLPSPAYNENSFFKVSVITSIGASTPVHKVKFRAPWFTSMPSQLTVWAPRFAASWRKRVFGSLKTTSLTTILEVTVS